MSVLSNPRPANGDLYKSSGEGFSYFDSSDQELRSPPDLQLPSPAASGYSDLIDNHATPPIQSQERVRRNTEPASQHTKDFASSASSFRHNLNNLGETPSDGEMSLDHERQLPAGILTVNNILTNNTTPNLNGESGKIPAQVLQRPKAQSDASSPRDVVLKLSADRLQELTSTPESLPLRQISYILSPQDDGVLQVKRNALAEAFAIPSVPLRSEGLRQISRNSSERRQKILTIDTDQIANPRPLGSAARPSVISRALSTPSMALSPKRSSRTERAAIPQSTVDEVRKHDARPAARSRAPSDRPQISSMPSSLPLPPLSIPTYLQLELSSHRPSHLYIHRSASADFPYESSKVKIERLLNFIFLPLQLELVLCFGTLTCVDAWLYTFTILPLRLLRSLYILFKSGTRNFWFEVLLITRFIFHGAGRMWRRGRDPQPIVADKKPNGDGTACKNEGNTTPQAQSHSARLQDRRNKSTPSTLLPDDKADLLKGLLIICTTLILLRFDASRTYHWIRGQAIVKLYVIYNVLEVCDRLLSAIGQDVLECLFSRETLERKPNGHSKILRPFWLFIVALVYTTAHAAALFHQVITLNVAVNAYSNALITLLMSNQFVEIKSTVFKKFEKENLFQLTCADIVERFQLWHMLIIIASRNIVESGALSQGFQILTATSPATATASNSSTPIQKFIPPLSATSILPRSFTMVPAIVSYITSYAPTVGHILGPFFVVLGSEMFVDWLKHAYINKFNNVKPVIYSRFLDVLAKDYYTNAFGEQNLTKRLGLPLIPLSCLLIRAGVQVYQMFQAACMPATPSSSTSLASIHQQLSEVRSTLPTTAAGIVSWTIDEIIHALPQAVVQSGAVSYLTTILVCLLIFLLLLACKLVLGMILLSFSRARYRAMKEQERNSTHHVEGGRRVGGWGVVEVDDDKRKWIYDDDPNGLRALKDREDRERVKREREKDKGVAAESFEHVQRYSMVAKRIW